MNSVLEILQTIIIGAVVGTFLLNTGRIIKAEDIFHECLVLLNGKALYKTKWQILETKVRLGKRRYQTEWGVSQE